MQKKNKSTFISYSSMDDINEVIHLKNYLESRKVDVFCDLERKQNNHAPIIDVLRERVKENDNLILLFTIESAKRLVSYGKSNKTSHNVAETNYTYEELKTAMENHKNVIPVCIDICHNDDEIKMLMRDLFCHCFSQNDSYSYIYKKTYHQINDFYLEILNRLTSASIVKHPDFSDVYWVGTHESDMPKLNSNYGFKGSISLFGHKNEDNKIVMCDCNCEKRVDHNDSTDLQQDDFIKESVHRVIKNDPNAKFMFYNPYAVYKLKLLEKFEKKHFLCLNNEDILKKVNNKRSFRDLIKDIVPRVNM